MTIREIMKKYIHEYKIYKAEFNSIHRKNIANR